MFLLALFGLVVVLLKFSINCVVFEKPRSLHPVYINLGKLQNAFDDNSDNSNAAYSAKKIPAHQRGTVSATAATSQLQRRKPIHLQHHDTFPDAHMAKTPRSGLYKMPKISK